MKSKNYKIDLEIYVVFILAISISVFNAIYSSLNTTKNQEMNNKIMAVDIPSLQALENMNLVVTRSEMYTTNWAYIISNKEDKENLKRLQSVEYPELKKRILELMSEWKDVNDIQNTKSIFSDFEQLVSYQKQVMESLVRFDDYQDPMKKFSAEEIVESQIIPRSSQIIYKLNGVITNKKNQAELLHASMRSSYRTLIWSVLGIAIMVVMVILFAAFYLSNYMIVPLMKLKNHILQMGKGEIPDITLSANRNAVGLMTEAVHNLSESIKRTTDFAHNIGEGNFKVEYEPLGPRDELGNALIHMRESLSAADADNKRRQWVAAGLDQLGKVLRDNTDDIEKLAGEISRAMVKFLNVQYGAIYLVENNHRSTETSIRLRGSYGPGKNQKTGNRIESDEEVIRQTIIKGETIHLKDAPEKYYPTGSPVNYPNAFHVLIVPLMNQGVIYGAMELISTKDFAVHEMRFIENIGETMGSTIASSKANTFTKNLLEETRKQAVRLAAKEDELRQTNDELSTQSSLLQASEEELKKSNTELKENAKLVAEQNERLEQARGALSMKVKELELNSKYKSEFLANMSHELRTPLNSVLILAKLLAENKSNSLTEKEIEYAGVIHKSGSDLLMLINDVLDLSKIEAGKIELRLAKESVKQIKDDMKSLFAEVANEKKIDFSIELHSDIPEFIVTDKLRIEQVIKNLLSNAFKFTGIGGTVVLAIKRPGKNIKLKNPDLLLNKNVIEFSVTDSGIGIPASQQQIIFEAFQQADGSINRKYGGTGLGLSISRMLVSLLGGELQLTSEKDKGSTFYLFVPVKSIQDGLSFEENPGDKLFTTKNLPGKDYSGATGRQGNPFPDTGYNFRGSEDTRVSEKGSSMQTVVQNNLSQKMYETLRDKRILVVDDDMRNIYALTRLLEQQGMNVVAAVDGKDALLKVRKKHFDIILMDVMMTEIDGIAALQEIRKQDKLKLIPIIMQSAKAIQEEKEKCIQLGASDYISKNINAEQLLALMQVWLLKIKSN